MLAEELLNKFKSMKSPNEIFVIYEDYNSMSPSEKDKLVNLGVGDSICMRYITAVEMKKKNEWDSYLENWENKRAKTWEDNLKDYMKGRNLSFPGK